VAFINCTQQVLLEDYITLFPPQLTVVEVLETVPPDDAMRRACERLRRAGYLIALDDFAFHDAREPLVSVADLIKVDLRATPLEQCEQMVKTFSLRGLRMLAEKVETRPEFLAALAMGFDYFQGYFFHQPVVVKARQIPALQLHYLQMLREVSRPTLDLPAIERLIKSEAAACYRLLRYLNSAAFFFAGEIRSVRHGLAVLGEREIRRWVSLVAAVGAGQQKSGELVTVALTRARFCELLSPRLRFVSSDLFLMGLLSLMDALLEMSMDEVLDLVPVSREIKTALRGEPGSLVGLRDLMLAQESGDWQRTNHLASQLGLTHEEVFAAFWQALQWAQEASHG
jgi:EAL and modified HD-GYP domain-containing signal transduction protein